MNFDFMMECEIKDPKIKAAYAAERHPVPENSRTDLPFLQ